MAAGAEGHRQSSRQGSSPWAQAGSGGSTAAEGEAGKARQALVCIDPAVILFYTPIYSKSFNTVALYKGKLYQQELVCLSVLYSYRF